MLKAVGVSVPLKPSQPETARKMGGKKKMEEGAHGESDLLPYT